MTYIVDFSCSTFIVTPVNDIMDVNVFDDIDGLLKYVNRTPSDSTFIMTAAADEVLEGKRL